MTTRRAFLKTSVVAGAALVVGVTWDGELFAIDKPSAAFIPNGWIRIEPTGKTILTIGKSEMGQGVRTSLAMILADELDADWSGVELKQASPGPNFKRLGTGGSWSIGGSWTPLRNAAAAARTMLVDAAAARWGVDRATCTTSGGAVRHEASGRKLTYGELTANAAKLPVPDKPVLKAMSALTLVGTPQSRRDAQDIVIGNAGYGIDAHVPGMVYASIERGKKVKHLDSAAARRVTGVIDVVTVPSGVAIIGENTWAAMKGRHSLVVEWDDASTFNSDDHMKALQAAAAAKEKVTVTRSEGSIAETLTGIDATYEYPFNVHAPVEPMNCLASVRDGKCELWVPTQAPNRVQERVAAALGIKPDDVQVNVTLLGGGFGRRLNADYAVEAAQVARAVGKPVQVLWTRKDDMAHGHFHMAAVHKMWGAMEDGKPAAWRHTYATTYHNVNGPPEPEELKDLAAFYREISWGVFDIPYVIPAIETSFVDVETPSISIGPWRSVYAASSVFARESFIDELAHAAKRDPLEFRLSLLDGAKDVFKVGSLTIDRSRLRRVLKLAAEKSGWGTPLPEGRVRGLACNVYDGETHTAYVAEVSVPKTPQHGLGIVVHRIVAAIDCGVVVNPRGIAQQVESGAVWALSNLMNQITFANGRAQQTSYTDFPVLRMSDCPTVIETYLVPSHGEQPLGIGEPVVPPVIPAVLNAVFAATGKRIRRLPMRLDA
ncbi:MAG TPA: molybdopterin cofactor-binding domain-containing protein [Thermoanaerobaculia bacterium]